MSAVPGWPQRILEHLRAFGVARWIIVGFLALIWVIGALWTDLNLGTLLGDCLVRAGMNGLLVLALVLPVRAGNGLNFGLPLGVVCGLIGGIAGLRNLILLGIPIQIPTVVLVGLCVAGALSSSRRVHAALAVIGFVVLVLATGYAFYEPGVIGLSPSGDG